MKSAKFYTARLRTASLRELAYRARQAFLTWRLRYLFNKDNRLFHVPLEEEEKDLNLPSFRGDVSQDTLNQILDGKIFNLNIDSSTLDAFEEKYRRVFSSDIKQEGFPDIRAASEPARLQHITMLLVYIACNPKSPESDKARYFSKNAVLQWIKENPFLFGPHYISAMECGLRIPVFFYCLKSLDDLSDIEYRLILDTIYLHGWWISQRLSLYSSLGNHTIAECVGLIFAGAVFRKTGEGRQWLEKGFGLLKKELDHQILDDGGPAEQSLSYHRFVLDLYWLSVDFLERNNLYDCSDIKPRLMRGEDFLNTFQYTHGDMPAIGDSDDGCAVAPGIAPRRPKTDCVGPGTKVFKHSGYTVINVEDGITLTFDHGPLGMPPLYNHGHADALSITLTKEGRQILVDPGTYKYNRVPKWREYFKGTRAHNTVTIDVRDQAVQETSFIWSKPFRSELATFREQEDVLFIEAIHDGYARLQEPVWHKRAILFFNGNHFIIKDSFKGRGIHGFELNYHLHPHAVVSKSQGFWLINNQGAKVFMRLLDEHDFLFARGREDPLLGWYSPAYGIKKKSGVLSCTKNGPAKEVSFVTAICTESPMEIEFLQERFSQFERQT